MDEARRELERRAAQGDPGAREKLEQAHIRAGQLPITLPSLGESQLEAMVGKWLVRVGDRVKRDQPVVELETDKITVELPAPDDGVLSTIVVSTGTTVPIGAVLARIAPTPPLDPTTEARHATLVSRIIASPEDEALRLEYADFLLETAGRELRVYPWTRELTALRGEHIRKHPRTRSGVSDGSPPELRTALDLLPFSCEGVAIEAGFVVGIAANLAWLTRHWAHLLACAPITALGVLGPVRDAAPLLALAGLERVRTLSLGDHSREALGPLAASGRLRPRRLVLRTVRPGEPLVTLGAAELVLHLPWRPPTDTATLAVLDALLAAVPPSVARVGVVGGPRALRRDALGERLMPCDPHAWW